jgi:hypothetical protein
MQFEATHSSGSMPAASSPVPPSALPPTTAAAWQSLDLPRAAPRRSVGPWIAATVIGLALVGGVVVLARRATAVPVEPPSVETTPQPAPSPAPVPVPVPVVIGDPAPTADAGPAVVQHTPPAKKPPPHAPPPPATKKDDGWNLRLK